MEIYHRWGFQILNKVFEQQWEKDKAQEQVEPTNTNNNITGMKRLIILLSVLCITLSMDAQSKWQLIPHLGGNVTKLFGHEKSGSDMGNLVDRLGLAVGTDVEYRLSEKWSLSGGLTYCVENYDSNSGYYSGGWGSGSSLRYHDVLTKLNTLRMPLLVGFHAGKYVILQTGLEPWYVLSFKEDNGGEMSKFSLSVPLAVVLRGEGFQAALAYSVSLDQYLNQGRLNTLTLSIGIPIEL